MPAIHAPLLVLMTYLHAEPAAAVLSSTSDWLICAHTTKQSARCPKKK